MNLTKFKKSFFATTLATTLALTPALTTFAAPATGTASSTPTPTATPDHTDQSDNSTEPEVFGKRDYYLTDELPSNIVAINRILDSEVYGNESYFLSVTNLGEEKSYYDSTQDVLSCGDNNHLSDEESAAQKSGKSVLTLCGGETLRVTAFYRVDNPLMSFKTCMGSFFPTSVDKGEVKTIWSSVYAENPLSSSEDAIDHGFNVVPIVAANDVILEYVPNSLTRYDYDKTVAEGNKLGPNKEETFFIEDVDEKGMSLLYSGNFYPKDADPSFAKPAFYPGEEPDDSGSCALSGYVTYKINVIPAPGITDKASAKAKEVIGDLSDSEAFQKYNDYMSGLGEKLGNGVASIVDSLKGK